MTSTPARPASATNNFVNVAGVVGFFTALAACRMYGYSGTNATLLAVLSYAAVVLILEVLLLRTPWRDSTGIDFNKRAFSVSRFVTRMVGVYGSFGFVVMLYWLFPEYHGSYYDNYWQAVRLLLPWIVILAVPYGIFMDSRLKEPRDSYYWFGRFLLVHWEDVNWRIISQHMLGWVVKAFFLPLMFVSIVGNINGLISINIHDATSKVELLHTAAVSLMYTLDLLAAVVGYVITLRLFDTHIRSTEPTAMGWWVCTMCYQPFLSIYMRLYLAYNGSESNWQTWLADYPTFLTIWSTISLVLLFFYMSASINFGCRFSNLTHRGVITNGMYRFTKHPAYLCKNTFWWMAYVPFVPMNGWEEAARYCLLLGGISTVYFLRARTEERHMSRDPAYVAYALWMNEHGVLSGLGKMIPFFRYKAPAGWENLPRYDGIK